MLPLEQQVTSRDISEDLKARGVPQDAIFCHAFYMGVECITLKGNAIRTDYVFCDAYTVSEIIAMLRKNERIIDWGFDVIDITPDKVAQELLYQIDSGFIRVSDL